MASREDSGTANGVDRRGRPSESRVWHPDLMFASCPLSSVSPDTILQSCSILVAVATFVVGLAIKASRDRRAANREIYQRLELASIDLFRFQADHLDLIRPLWQRDTPLPSDGTAERVAFFDYVCQILNLFEMAIRFCKERVMPPDVFHSWLVWIYEVAGAPNFHAVWGEISSHYTGELRCLIAEAIAVRDRDLPEERRRDAFSEFADNLIARRVIPDTRRGTGPREK